MGGTGGRKEEGVCGWRLADSLSHLSSFPPLSAASAAISFSHLCLSFLLHMHPPACHCCHAPCSLYHTSLHALHCLTAACSACRTQPPATFYLCLLCALTCLPACSLLFSSLLTSLPACLPAAFHNIAACASPPLLLPATAHFLLCSAGMADHLLGQEKDK